MDFGIDKNQSDHNGVDTICNQFDYGFFLDKYMDVTVDISATTRSNFAQLLFPNAMHNEVDAITRVRPRQPIVFGNALVALSPQTCSGNKYGALFLGTGDTKLYGGGVFSNGCVRGNGTASVIVDGGGIYGHYLDIGGGTYVPAPETTTFTIPESNYDIPVPARDSHGNCIGGENVVGDLPATMHPGLWCVTGGLTLHGDYTGTDVTIVVLTGDVKVNGQPLLQLSAPPSSPNPSPAIPGVLLYLPISNPSSVTLNGGANSLPTRNDPCPQI